MSSGRNETYNGVRQRVRRDYSPTIEDANNREVPVLLQRHERRQSIPSSVVTLVLIFYSTIFCLQVYMENYHLSTPLMLSDAKNNPDSFISERAMNRLLKLTSLGPRVSGSHANEVLAIQVLLDEVKNIRASSHNSKSIEVDVQRVSGSYPLTFLDGLTNYYINVPNVVVRLSSNPSWNHSLLVNCHFDSVPDSPGGSDDGASCANMLELLQVLASSTQSLKHNVIFLFNGAEENLMHASHGFITQHPWAKEVRAFINLEACGAGGRELLFQSGPNSPWLMKTYADTVPRPFASSMAQEIFESGMVPGDTDFRVFRDFGNISGLDFAWSTNGYVYHTRFDNADQIPLGTLQRTGNNILELIRGLANAPELEDPVKYRPGNLVYFDILGLVVIHWTEAIANILNISAVSLAFLVVFLNKKEFEKRGLKSNYYWELVKIVGVIGLGSIICTVVSLAVSLFVTAVGRNLSWYGRPTWLLFLYVIPCITTIMSIQLYNSRSQMKVFKSKTMIIQAYCDAYLLLWTAVLIVAIYFQIRSGCLAWLMVISPVISNLARTMLGYNKYEPGIGWLVIFLLGLVGPVLQYSGMQVGVLSLFVPILGRSGSSFNPDVVVGLYCTYTFALLFSYASPLITLERHPVKLLKFLTGVSLISLVLLICTNIGFPFSSDPAAPKPERFMLVHSERLYHNFSRVETSRQTGYWIIDLDYISPHTVDDFVPEIRNAEPVRDCDTQLYCGVPYLMPALNLVPNTHWIPGPAPQMAVPTKLNLLAKEFIHANKTLLLRFAVTGPDHMGLVFSPRPNVTVVGWSLNSAGPVESAKFQGRPSYFVYYACAKDCVQWSFDIEVKPINLRVPAIDLAIIGHHLHGPHQRSKIFQNVIDKFPPWTAVTAFTSSYKSYVF